MSNKMFSFLSVLFVLTLLLSACASPTATQAPPTEAPKAEPQAIETPAAEAEPAASGPVVPEKYVVNQPQAFYEDWVSTIGGEEFLFSPVTGEPKVGILGVSKTHEFQQRRDNAAVATADQMGIDLTLDSFESDVALQRTRSEDMVSKGVQCLISTSRDDDSWIALGGYLKDNNVMFYGEGGTANSLTREQLPNYIGYVGVSNYMNAYNGGVWAANYFNENFPDQQPSVAIVNYPTSPIGWERGDGFIAGFQSVRPDMEIVFYDGMGSGAGRADVLPYTEDLFTSKKFNVFYSIWDEPAMAALTAAQARGLTPKDLMIVGYDGTIETAKVIKEPGSLMVADIGQAPDEAGRVTTAICAKLLTGELKLDQIPVFLYLPGFLITQETADEFLKMVGAEE